MEAKKASPWARPDGMAEQPARPPRPARKDREAALEAAAEILRKAGLKDLLIIATYQDDCQCGQPGCTGDHAHNYLDGRASHIGAALRGVLNTEPAIALAMLPQGADASPKGRKH